MSKERFVRYLLDRQIVAPRIKEVLNQAAPLPREPLGMIAVQHGLMKGDQIDRILNTQRESPRLFGDLAVEMRILRREQIDRLLRIQEFRVNSHVAEALVLSGAMKFDEALGQLGEFFRAECCANTMAEALETAQGTGKESI